jgi:hypothetical protein
MAQQLVKVQRPLFPNDGPWLVYDAQRKVVEQIPPHKIPPKVRAKMSGKNKDYFWAELVGGQWQLTAKLGYEEDFV